MITKSNYLNYLADLIIKQHVGRFKNLKIILPNGLACQTLTNILIGKLKITILPQIISLSEMIIDNEEVFKVPTEKVGAISKIEEKIILAKQISNYEAIYHNQVQALKISPSLANLFFELESNNIDIHELASLPDLDQAEYWQRIHHFLINTYNRWKSSISSSNKSTLSSYYKLVLELEYERLLNNKEYYLIVAGVISENRNMSNFLEKISILKNALIVNPPFANNGAKYFDYNVSDLIASNINNIKSKKVELREFDNIFYEAEFIAHISNEAIKNNPKIKIAILTHSQKIKENYSLYLNKYGLSYRDLMGNDLSLNNIISLLFILAKLKYNNFDLKAFFNLLSHPLIISDSSIKIKKEILKHNKYVNNFEEINNILLSGDKANYDLFLQINQVKEHRAKSDKFNDIVKNLISSAESLVKNIWTINNNINNVLREISHLGEEFKIKNLTEFCEIFNQIISGARLMDFNDSNANIIITNPSNTVYSNFDIVFITDLNEETYPNVNNSNLWVNNKYLEALGIKSLKYKLDKKLFDFYLNFDNEKIYLTRSKRDLDNKKTLPSSFLLHAQGVIFKNFVKINSNFHYDLPVANSKITQEEYATSQNFPDILYATDIETLIKAPYNFYAKKILKLRKLSEVEDNPSLAEFGNLFHIIAQEYSLKYCNLADKIELFNNIVDVELDNYNAPKNNKNLWRIKLKALAWEFIEFDNASRIPEVKIYCELEGQLSLKINEHNMQIKAIADRIELSKTSIRIIDYKTGALPTKKEVFNGTAPQLIIEAIIAHEGGFGFACPSIIELVYVKINSSEPYLEINNFNFTAEELFRHKEGLVKLLNYYITKKTFLTQISKVKYDDYKQLARRN